MDMPRLGILVWLSLVTHLFVDAVVLNVLSHVLRLHLVHHRRSSSWAVDIIRMTVVISILKF